MVGEAATKMDNTITRRSPLLLAGTSRKGKQESQRRHLALAAKAPSGVTHTRQGSLGRTCMSSPRLPRCFTPITSSAATGTFMSMKAVLQNEPTSTSWGTNNRVLWRS